MTRSGFFSNLAKGSFTSSANPYSRIDSELCEFRDVRVTGGLDTMTPSRHITFCYINFHLLIFVFFICLCQVWRVPVHPTSAFRVPPYQMDRQGYLPPCPWPHAAPADCSRLGTVTSKRILIRRIGRAIWILTL